MTDKKEISVNESLAGVNKILRSAGDLILPRETNIALSILADVACQQQEEIDALRERVQGQLPSDTSDVPERRADKNLLIALDALGCAPVLDVLGREPICNDTIKYARNLFLHIESKVKDLIKESETLRNAEKCKSQNLPMTIEHFIGRDGTVAINAPAIEVISHLIKDGSIPLGEKCKEDREDMIRSIYESLNPPLLKGKIAGTLTYAGDFENGKLISLSAESKSQSAEKKLGEKNSIYSFGDLRLSGNIEVTPNEGFNIYSRNAYRNGAHIGKICYGYKLVCSEGLIPESELISLINQATENAPGFK